MVCAIYKFFSNNSTTMLNHVKKTLSVGFCFRPSLRWPMWQCGNKPGGRSRRSVAFIFHRQSLYGPRWH